MSIPIREVAEQVSRIEKAMWLPTPLRKKYLQHTLKSYFLVQALDEEFLHENYMDGGGVITSNEIRKY